ncbi:MAG: MlaD family protein [Verrucomicrobiota bacterium]
MALQDLTPQLRTRLNRVERAVGLFVTAATLLLLAGLAYYIYHTAQRKGWFKIKVQYSTSLNNAAGLKPGEPVKLMGFTVGRILEIKPNEPDDWYGVTVFFEIQEPNYGYVWLDSKVRVAPADFLGNRYLEIVKGKDGEPTVLGKSKNELKVLNPEMVKQTFKELKAALTKSVASENPGFTAHALNYEVEEGTRAALNKLIHEQPAVFYTNFAAAKPYWIEPLESPALTERLDTLVNGLESALPNILNLTNQLVAVLANTARATEKLGSVVDAAHPLVTNLNFISANLRDPKGSLGEWLFPTNLNQQLTQTLQRADITLANTDSNLTSVVTNLNRTLENLANVTSNLNVQVQSNSNILSNVSQAVVHSDELVQGLQRHWLLRSAFKKKEDKTVSPKKSVSPKQRK